jgi:Spy/CpxP family protein refolding chaperone
MRSNWMMGVAGAALALVVVALLGAGTAYSKPGRGGCHGHGKGAGLDRLEAKLAELELDADTRAAAARVLEQARADRAGRRDEMRDARRALHELLEREQPAVDQVMAQADAVGALQTEAHKAKLRTMLELRALVGAEQWQELKGSLHHRHGHDEPMGKS